MGPVPAANPDVDVRLQSARNHLRFCDDVFHFLTVNVLVYVHDLECVVTYLLGVLVRVIRVIRDIRVI